MRTVAYRFVLPNTSEMNRRGRGGLLPRIELAGHTGCDLVEVPADFIKNKTEIELTGLPMGTFLDRRALEILYRADPIPGALQVIFHTEPEINLPGVLRWHEPAWVASFIEMQIALAERLGVVPMAIEIHPGSRPNTTADIIAGAKRIHQAFLERFGRTPLILLENRTGQVVSDGRDLLEVWQAAERQDTAFRDYFGIVLDVQQLFTQMARRLGPQGFLANLNLIPGDALRAFHIHHRHRIASFQDPIPWREVFDRIRQFHRTILINPEIHHSNGIQAAVDFCRRLLEDNQAATA